jgi:hypothetical protein
MWRQYNALWNVQRIVRLVNDKNIHEKQLQLQKKEKHGKGTCKIQREEKDDDEILEISEYEANNLQMRQQHMQEWREIRQQLKQSEKIP